MTTFQEIQNMKKRYFFSSLLPEIIQSILVGSLLLNKKKEGKKGCFCVMSDSSSAAYFSHQPKGIGCSRVKTDGRVSIKYFFLMRFNFKALLFSFTFQPAKSVGLTGIHQHVLYKL